MLKDYELPFVTLECKKPQMQTNVFCSIRVSVCLEVKCNLNLFDTVVGHFYLPSHFFTIFAISARHVICEV